MTRRRQPPIDTVAAFQVAHVVDTPGSSDWVNTQAPRAFVDSLSPSSLRAALADPRDRDLVLAAVDRLVDTNRLPADWRDLARNYTAEESA